jgi:uncharacterized protein (DUF433 family)
VSAAIVNNRIDGTRITIYDIVYYLERGRRAEEIARILPVTLEQVQTAIQYIEEHKAEVMEVHRQIEERHARGNPPEIKAQLQESHARLMAWLEERRRAKERPEAKSQEVNGEGNPGRR